MLATWSLSSVYQAVLGLFAAGEPGIWIDNSDWQTSWYQDAAGTTPVTAMEQPLGLALSKDKGLAVGTEIVTNGSNLVSTTGWTAGEITGGAASTLSVSGGNLVITNTGATYGSAEQTLTTVAGKWYLLTLNITKGTASSANFRVGTTLHAFNLVDQGPFTGTNQAVRVMFLATSTTSYLALYNQSNSGANNTFGSISCKQIAGNHAFQPTSGVRPVVSARVNLLTYTSTLTVDWGGNKATLAASSVISPDGVTTMRSVIPTAVSGNHSLDYSTGGNKTIVGGSAVHNIWVKANGYNKVALREDAASGQYAAFDLSNGTVLDYNTTGAPTIAAVGGGIYLIRMTVTGQTSQRLGLYVLSPAYTTGVITGSWTPDGTSGIYAWGADLRPSDQATGLIPTYQRVNTSSDYDGPDKGFPPYISLNGTQWMQTAAVDYSGVNKMLIVAGVRKLTDASTGMIFELGNAGTPIAGSTNIYTSAAQKFTYSNASNVVSVSTAASAAPRTAVVTGLGDCTGNVTTVRLNTVQTQDTSVVGVGGFANAASYIGSRAGTSLFFTGQISQLIVRGSTVAANAGQISTSEAYANQRTRAY